MKEDILEQLVDDYLQARGYFTRHNIKFRPRRDHPDFISNQDSNHSDIDVLGYHPKLSGPERVMAVSCKSWQSGFNVVSIIDAIERDQVRGGRKIWKPFRELLSPKWSEAFIKAVDEATGSAEFTYVTAVTSIRGEAAAWENYQPFSEAMKGNPIRLRSLGEMITDVLSTLSTTVAGSHLGRTLQLIKASGCSISVGEVISFLEQSDA